MIPRTGCYGRRAALRALGALALGPAVSAWLVGCGRNTDAPEPPSIEYDRDTCDWCRMTIDDPRLAAAFVPGSGRALKFGEPGCLLSWLAEHPGTPGLAFLTTREQGAWQQAASVTLARGGVRTPMGFDLAAWQGVPASGEPVSWTQLVQQGKPRAQPR